MRKIKFLRSETVRFLRLGKKRRKLQKWRRPRGRHSKIRKKRVSYPLQPSIGFKQQSRGETKIVINSMREMMKLGKGTKAIISRRIGAKTRIEMLKKASEMGIVISGGAKK